MNSDDKPTHEPGALVFSHDGRGSVVAKYFGLFVAVSFAVHWFGFYLFQVVYPVTGRVEPVPRRVTVLDPTQPAVAALMRQVDDRVVFLRPASSGSDVRVNLGDHSVRFRPSFADRPPAFRAKKVEAVPEPKTQTPPPP
jgi:hypothetical protein